MDNLLRIKIKGFKSIKELDLEIKPINVLIGANGSGKSNFISVFRLLENISTQRLQTYIKQNGSAERFLHFGNQITDEIEIDLELRDKKYLVLLAKNNEEDTLFIRHEEYRDSGGTLEAINTNTLESDEGEYLKECKLYHFHDTSATAKFKSFQNKGENKFLDSFASNLAPFLYHLKNNFFQDYKNIVQAVQTVAPYFQNFDFNIQDENILLRWQHKNDLSNLGFSAQTLSDGTARFICMATLFLQPKELRPKTIVLDEPEIGLHPAAIAVLSEIIQAVANDGAQVIISTQSVELANYFEPDDFIVVNYENDESKLKRLDKEDFEGWIETYQVGDAWSEGLLGGDPKW